MTWVSALRPTGPPHRWSQSCSPAQLPSTSKDVLDKYVPLSPQRFAATACTEHGVSATVCGAAGEAGIVLTALRPSMADGQPAPAREVVSQKVTLPEQGGCVTVVQPIAHQKRPSASGPVAASGGLPAPLHMERMR